MSKYDCVVRCRSTNYLLIDLDILERDGFSVQNNLIIHVIKSIRIASPQSALHVILSCVVSRWESEKDF